MTMNRTTMLFIRKTLEQCAKCPGFHGAVLSSPDGLVLASFGNLGGGDEAAACASSLIMDSNSNLSFVSGGKAKEILIWSEDKIWNVHHLATNCIFLIASSDIGNPQAVREMALKTGEMLDQALRILG